MDAASGFLNARQIIKKGRMRRLFVLSVNHCLTQGEANLPIFKVERLKTRTGSTI